VRREAETETIEAPGADARRASPGGVDLDRVRAALLPHPDPRAPGEEGRARKPELIDAAVLFPIVRREAAPTVLLTRRTEQLRDHPGQISFPGGRVEAGDASPEQTALREAGEEVGLAARHVEIAGFLPEHRTGTGYRITPVVGFLTPPFSLRADPTEVAEIFEVPLAYLLDPANLCRHSRQYGGETRHFFALPYGPYFIWGATAGMIVSLARAMA
jgi:8-oxo-dGTP pyrophosphatase MutT (NUDIX family)